MATSDGAAGGQPGERGQVRSTGTAQTKVPGESARSGETRPCGGIRPELREQFGRYRIKATLGVGGMGTVYLVENTELQREEALKVPHFQAGDDSEMRERFLREARAAAKLEHQNLCPVHDVGVLDGVYYLTMRYLKGKLLSDYAGKAVPVRRAVEIVARLAQALEYAHSKGVIHRDLKPTNVMLCPGTGPTIMDFGLAKQTRQVDERLTQKGMVVGTPDYMPPEQARGELDRMGPASDVYSLGVILFETAHRTIALRGHAGGDTWQDPLRRRAAAVATATGAESRPGRHLYQGARQGGRPAFCFDEGVQRRSHRCFAHDVTDSVNSGQVHSPGRAAKEIRPSSTAGAGGRGCTWPAGPGDGWTGCRPENRPARLLSGESGQATGKQRQIRVANARLRQMPPVEVRAGRTVELPVVINRSAADRELQIRFTGLPPVWECPDVTVPAGSGQARVKACFWADLGIVDGSATLRVSLWRDEAKLDEQFAAAEDEEVPLPAVGLDLSRPPGRGRSTTVVVR